MIPERFHRLREVLTLRQPDLTVLMDQVNKAHNFSAILRNCDAAGVMEAHAIPPEQGMKLSRMTSAGSEKWLRVHRHDQVAEGIAQLQDRGFRVFAAHPAPRARDFREADYTGPTAFLVGAELHGVSPEGLAAADEHVVIPMKGMVQSFNVSVAAALLLYEAVRQREAAGLYDAPSLPPKEFRDRLFEWAYPRIARRCRRAGIPYPDLDEDGDLLGPVPGTLAFLRRKDQH